MICQENNELTKDQMIDLSSQRYKQGIVIGILIGFNADHQPLVAFADNPKQQGIIARSTQPLEPSDIGKAVALLFEAGDPEQAIIIGFMQRTDPEASQAVLQDTIISGVQIGEILAVEKHQVWVDFPANPSEFGVPALSNVRLNKADIDRPCTLMFENANPLKPIILGLLQTPEDAEQPLNLSSDTGVMIACGGAKLEIKTDGDVELYGRSLTSRAYGPHRIQGASVKIN